MVKRFLLIIFIANSCSYPEMIRNELVYENDFEQEKLANIAEEEYDSIIQKSLEILIMMDLLFF